MSQGQLIALVVLILVGFVMGGLIIRRSISRSAATVREGTRGTAPGVWLPWTQPGILAAFMPVLEKDQTWFDALPVVPEAAATIEQYVYSFPGPSEPLRPAVAALLAASWVPPRIFDTQPLPDGRQVETRFSFDKETGRVLGLWSRSVEGGR